MTDQALPLDGVDEPDYGHRWIPLGEIFGVNAVPSDVANVVLVAIDRLIHNGDVDPATPWRALEYMAAEVINQ